MALHFCKNISKVGLSENIKLVSDELREWVEAPKDKSVWRKGKRLLFNKLELFEQHGDNVVKNEVTCRAEFREYRVPRIVKNMIARKLCQTKENI